MAIKRINPSRNAWDNTNRQNYGYVIRVPKLPDAHKFVKDFIVFNEADNCFYKCVEVSNDTQHYYTWRAVTFGSSRAYLIPVGKLTTTDINDATEGWTEKGFVGCIPKTLNEIVFGMRRYRGTVHYPIGYTLATGKYLDDHTYYKWSWNDTTDSIEMVLRKRFTGELKEFTDYTVGDDIEDEVYTLAISTDPSTGEPNWGDITMTDMAAKANELIERLNQHEADIPLADASGTIDTFCKTINLMIEEVNPFCIPWQLLLNRQNFLENEVGQVTLQTEGITAEIQALRVNLAKWASVEWECFYFATADETYQEDKDYYIRSVVAGGVIPHNYTYTKVESPTIGAKVAANTYEKYEMPTELLYGTVVQAVDAALNLIRYKDVVTGRLRDLTDFPVDEGDTLVAWLNRLKLKVDTFYESIEDCKISLKQIHDSIGDVGFVRARDEYFQDETEESEWTGYYYWDVDRSRFILIDPDEYPESKKISEWEEEETHRTKGWKVYQFYNSDIARTLIAKNAADILINKQDVDNLLGTQLKRIYVEKLDIGVTGQTYYYFDRSVNEYDNPFISFVWTNDDVGDPHTLEYYQNLYKSPIFVASERNEYIVTNETVTRAGETYYYRTGTGLPVEQETETDLFVAGTIYYRYDDDNEKYAELEAVAEDPTQDPGEYQYVPGKTKIGDKDYPVYVYDNYTYTALSLATGTDLSTYRTMYTTLYVKKETAAVQIRVNNEEIGRVGHKLYNFKIDVETKIEEVAKKSKRLKQLTGVNGDDDTVTDWNVDGYLKLPGIGQFREYRKYYKLDETSTDPLRFVEMISGTEDEYDVGYKFILTVDETFREGVDYYTRSGATESTYVYELAEVTAGDVVLPKTYYNQVTVDYVIPFYALTEDLQFVSGKTYYTVNTDGKYVPVVGIVPGDPVPEDTYYEFHNPTPRGEACDVYIRKARKEHGGYEENNTHRGLIDRNTRDIEDQRQACGNFQKWTKKQLQALEDFIFSLMISTLEVITQERSTLSLLHQTIGKFITLHNALEKLRGNQTMKPADGIYDSGYYYYTKGVKEEYDPYIVIEPQTGVTFDLTEDTKFVSGKQYYTKCGIYYAEFDSDDLVGTDIPEDTYYEMNGTGGTIKGVIKRWTGSGFFLTEDAVFASGKTYYTRDGKGTVRSPYIYSEYTDDTGAEIPEDTYYEWFDWHEMTAGTHYEIGLEVGPNIYTTDLVIATTENYTINEIRLAVNRALNYHITNNELPMYTELPDTDIILESMTYYRYVDEEWEAIVPETDDPTMIGMRIKDYDPMNKWYIKTGEEIPDGSDDTKRYTETPIRMFLNELVKMHRKTSNTNSPMDLANSLILGLGSMPNSSTYGTLPNILSGR